MTNTEARHCLHPHPTLDPCHSKGIDFEPPVLGAPYSSDPDLRTEYKSNGGFKYP